MSLVAACLASWLLGGIPFGLVVVRLLKGVDIRTIGSGNVGATNASRAFGATARLPVFLLIYALDFLKGLVPTALAPAAAGLADAGLHVPVAVGACAIAGHCWSPFLRLAGGKGVATATGVFAVLDPLALGIALLVFGAVFAFTRQVFLGSLALGLALAGAVVLRDPDTAFDERLAVTVFAAVLAALLFYTHRSNIRRFLQRRAAEASAP
jgi:glycerol-3-phosphate acyltransferase PlsY